MTDTMTDEYVEVTISVKVRARKGWYVAVDEEGEINQFNNKPIANGRPFLEGWGCFRRASSNDTFEQLLIEDWQSTLTKAE